MANLEKLINYVAITRIFLLNFIGRNRKFSNQSPYSYQQIAFFFFFFFFLQDVSVANSQLNGDQSGCNRSIDIANLNEINVQGGGKLKMSISSMFMLCICKLRFRIRYSITRRI